MDGFEIITKNGKRYLRMEFAGTYKDMMIYKDGTPDAYVRWCGSFFNISNIL